MTVRIGDTRRVSYLTTESVAIGYRDCAVCGVETPTPPDDVLVDFARASTGSTLWPGRNRDEWVPEGWAFCDLARGMICPDCAAAVRVAIATRSTGPR